VLRRPRKLGNCHGNDQGRRLTDQKGIQNNKRRFHVVQHIIHKRTTFRQKSIAQQEDGTSQMSTSISIEQPRKP
jgi:hypothetical protein